MKCPLCGRNLVVQKTFDGDGYKVTRQRACLPGCDYRACTDEILPEYWETDAGKSELAQRISEMRRMVGNG